MEVNAGVHVDVDASVWPSAASLEKIGGDCVWEGLLACIWGGGFVEAWTGQPVVMRVVVVVVIVVPLMVVGLRVKTEKGKYGGGGGGWGCLSRGSGRGGGMAVVVGGQGGGRVHSVWDMEDTFSVLVQTVSVVRGRGGGGW